MKRWIGIWVVCIVCGMLLGCGKAVFEPLAEATPKIPESGAELAVWSAYWDAQKDSEIELNEGRFDRLMVFAAYFQNGKLFLPEESKRLLTKVQALRDPGFDVWLTVVNDDVTDGVSKQKDVDLLWALFEEEDAIEEHAEQLVRMADKYDCDGIEIDYEKIRTDMDLWERFIHFEEILLKKAEEYGMGVRIVLEPSTPIEELNFPAEAEYVVMCYNLHGYGTEPGPKADYAFLEKIYARFSRLENLSFALANGGFVWKDGKVSAIGEDECVDSAIRDESSGALVQEKQGETIWYGDKETIRLWMDYLEQLAGHPVKISIWKL